MAGKLADYAMSEEFIGGLLRLSSGLSTRLHDHLNQRAVMQMLINQDIVRPLPRDYNCQLVRQNVKDFWLLGWLIGLLFAPGWWLWPGSGFVRVL